MSVAVGIMNPNGHPHENSRPFGYEFNFSGDPFPDPSDIPNSGPPLLNSLENTFLGDFFFSQSQQTATSDFDFASVLAQSYNQAQDQTHRFSEPDFNWLITEPPPTLVEAAPALQKSPTPPAQNYHAMPMDFHAFSNPNVAASQHQVLGAPPMLNASVASQALHVSPPALVSAQSTSTAMEPIHAPSAIPAAVSAPYAPPPQAAPVSSPDLVFGFPKPMAALDPINTAVSTTHDFSFSGPHTAPPQPTRGEEYNSRLYRFGSDSHFASTGFQPQNTSESARAIEKSLLRDLFIIQPIAHSDEHTPVPTSERSHSRKRSIATGEDDDGSEDDGMRKRRRADSSDDDGTPVRRTSNFKARRISAPDALKRRRSSTSAAKAPRENLSEEQKRNNHIMSEQKRRDLIKRGFEELHHLVPELRAGGLSKSSVLMESASFLERLVEVNGELRRRLGKFD